MNWKTDIPGPNAERQRKLITSPLPVHALIPGQGFTSYLTVRMILDAQRAESYLHINCLHISHQYHDARLRLPHCYMSNQKTPRRSAIAKQHLYGISTSPIESPHDHHRV